jgi:hypothetical protein
MPHRLVGQGMNLAELQANPMLTEHVVHASLARGQAGADLCVVRSESPGPFCEARRCASRAAGTA